jgi:hypothetical protein
VAYRSHKQLKIGVKKMQARRINKFFMVAITITIVATMVLSGCGTAKTTSTPNSAASYPSLDQSHPPIRTGDISTGAKVLETTQSVDSSGSMVAVSKTGDPLDGFVIDVPSGSYSNSTTFSVSSAPITTQTFGSDVTPISPMIYVDNGGTYSNDFMYIRVPVQVTAGDFAMGFYYDPTTEQLEGMPLIAIDANSITVAAKHFSDFFISEISDTLLTGDINSGFLPGVDDWEFPNYGTYLSQGGQCEGQSLTALWYYCTQPDGADARLYGRYDNNGDQPATPSLWQDDSWGYRFASVVQEDINANDFANKLWYHLGGKMMQKDATGTWQEVDGPGIGDEATWDSFAYSIKVTKEPQLVCIRDDSGNGHAMIVYGISDGNLLVADPNYPGNTERVIKYANGEFEPYNSGANAEDIANGYGTEFDNIAYFAKSTVLSWETLNQLWIQFKNGTIGDDKFPSYQIVTKDSKGKLQPLSDGYMSDSKNLIVSIKSSDPNIVYNVLSNGDYLTSVSPNTFELQPGNNKLGICVQGSVQETDKDGKTSTVYKCVDFKYLTVYDSESPTTTTTTKTTTAAAVSGLTSLQQSKSIFIHIIIAATLNESPMGTSTPSSKQVDCSSDIVWNGTSFTGTETNGIDTIIHYSVNGTVSADGNILLTLVLTEDWTDSSGNSDHGSYSISNMPIQNVDQYHEYYGADAGKYITDFQDSGDGHDNSSAPFTFTYSSPNGGDSRNQLNIQFETTPMEQ